MKTSFAISLCILTVSLTGCIHVSDWPSVQGSGRIVTEPREVHGFSRVSLGGPGEVTMVQGDEESLTVVADDNLLPYIRSEVRGDALHIGPENVNLRSTHTIQYRLHFKNLNDLHLSGSLRATVESLKTDRLSLRISGSGKIEVNRLDAQSLSAHISGSGTTAVAGAAERQEISISGSGDHRAADLKSSQVDVHVSGSGKATLWAADSLKANISGSGRVEYRGRPRVDSHISGSGRVRPVAGEE